MVTQLAVEKSLQRFRALPPSSSPHPTASKARALTPAIKNRDIGAPSRRFGRASARREDEAARPWGPPRVHRILLRSDGNPYGPVTAPHDLPQTAPLGASRAPAVNPDRPGLLGP